MRKRSKFFTFFCLSAVTFLTGCGVGNVLFPANRPDVNVSDFDDPELQNKYMDRVSEAPDTISNINDVLFMTAGTLRDSKYWTSLAEGKVTAKVGGMIPYDQHVLSKRTINVSEEERECFFQTNAISAFVTAAEQRFTNKNSWLVRKGKNPKLNSADYTNSKIIGYSQKGYLNVYGNTQDGLCNYVLNDFSVLNGEYKGMEDDLYIFYYQLDPKIAGGRYIREVKYMANASDYPLFKNAELTIKIDKNYRVHELISNDIYNVSIMNGLDCNSKIVDKFTYYESNISIPEKEDFKEMFGVVNNEGDVVNEKQAMDYLQDAAEPFLSSKNPINIEVDLNMEGNKLPIFVSLDLNKQIAKVSLDDKVLIYYFNNKAYLYAGDKLNFVVDKDQLLEAVELFIPGFSINNISLEKLLNSSLIQNMMGNIDMVKTNNSVILNIEAEGMLVKMNLDLNSNDKASFSNIEFSKLDDFLSLNGKVSFNVNEHKFIDMPTDLNEINNLTSFATALNEYIVNKRFKGNINAKVSDELSINGSFAFDLSTINQGSINLDLTYKGEVISLEFVLFNNNIYLLVNDVTVKLSIDEVKSLIKNIFSHLDLSNSSSSIDSLLSCFDLSNLYGDLEKINSSINHIMFEDDCFDISIGLDSVSIGSDVNIKHVFETNEFTFDYSDIVKINVIPGDVLSLTIPNKVDVGYDHLNNLMNSIFSFIDEKKFELNGSVLLSENDRIDIKALIDLNTKELSGSISFSLLNMQGKIKFAYSDNQILFYISDEIKAKLTPEEMIQLYDKLKEILNQKIDLSKLSLPKLDPNEIKIGDLLKCITLNKNSLNVDLDFGILGLPVLSDKNVKIEYNYDLNQIDIKYDESLFSLKLNTNIAVEVIDSKGAMGYSEIEGIIDSIYNLASSTTSFDINLNINNKSYTANYKTDGTSISLYLPLSETEYIHIYYEGNDLFFIDALGLKLSGSKTSMLKVLNNAFDAYKDKLDISVVGKLMDLISVESGNEYKININNAIKKFDYNEQSLLLVVDKYSIEVSFNNDEFVTIKSNDFTATFIKNQSNAIPEFNKLDCVDLSELEKVSLATYLDIYMFLNSKSYSLNLNGVKFNLGGNQYSISGRAIIDLVNKAISFEGTLSDGVETSNLSVVFIDKTFYIDLNNGNMLLKVSLDELTSLIPSDGFDSASNIDLSNIIRSVLSSMKSLSVTDNSINIGFKNTDYNVEGYIKYINEYGLVINCNYGEVSISSSSYGVEINDLNNEYVSLTTLLSYGKELQGYSKLQGSIEVSTYITKLGKIDIIGSVGIDTNNKLNLEFNLAISNSDFFVNVNIKKIGMDYYIDLGNLKIKLNNDELFNLIFKINDTFNLGLDEESVMNFKHLIESASTGNINELLGLIFNNDGGSNGNSPLSLDAFTGINLVKVINSLKLDANNLSLSLPLSNVIAELGNIDISLRRTADGESDLDKFVLNIDGDSSLKNVYLEFNNSLIVSTPSYASTAYIYYNELVNIIEKSTDLMNTISKKQFALSVDGNVKSDGVITYSYKANLSLDISDTKNIKMKFNAEVIGPQNTGNALSYRINGSMVDNTLYMTYNENLNIQMDIKQMLQLVRYLTELLHINSDLISGILDGVTEGLGGGVFDNVIPDMSSLNIDINKFIHSLSVEKSEETGLLGALNLMLNCEDIYANMSGFNPNLDKDGNIISTTNTVLNASINTENGYISEINISNVYASLSEIFSINVIFDNSIYNSEIVDLGINVPSDTSIYYNFNDITPLVKMFVNTANIASYDLIGELFFTLYLKVGSINLGSVLGTKNIPIRVQIELDENSIPNVHVTINCNKAVSYLFITVFAKGTIDIYYTGKTQELYIRRDGEYKYYGIAELQDNDKLCEMINFIMKPSSMVSDQIKKNMNGGFVVNNPIKFENILNQYESTYSNNIYNYHLNISGSTLLKENLDNIDLKIETIHSSYEKDNEAISVDYLKKIDVETILMNMLKIRVNGSLENIYSDKMYTSVPVEIPAGMLENKTGW